MRDPDLGPYLARLELALQDGHYDRAHRIVDDFERTQSTTITTDTSLSELDGVPVRLCNLLERHGITTVGDCLARSRDELISLSGLRSRSVAQLVAALERLPITEVDDRD